MRKLIAAAGIAGSIALLAACSDGAEDAAVTTEQPAADGADTAAGMPSDAEVGVFDANNATAEQLSGIDGVTPELAAAIVAGQPYADATAFNAKLLETLSADEAKSMLEKVFVPVNLNTASEEAIKLIPGMTPKMEHEFMEYRPYEDMAEFDREIGKYVDEAEVARFRNYVTL